MSIATQLPKIAVQNITPSPHLDAGSGGDVGPPYSTIFSSIPWVHRRSLGTHWGTEKFENLPPFKFCPVYRLLLVDIISKHSQDTATSWSWHSRNTRAFKYYFTSFNFANFSLDLVHSSIRHISKVNTLKQVCTSICVAKYCTKFYRKLSELQQKIRKQLGWDRAPSFTFTTGFWHDCHASTPFHILFPKTYKYLQNSSNSSKSI